LVYKDAPQPEQLLELFSLDLGRFCRRLLGPG
jgi:hypothetical protein